ncbi:hypothetical protein M093_3588 [Bacteroides uniformis str. 3978 T3 i]|uniref:Uncharacterized protein n=1 Tax=Bacteroides uniformis str. 3978 T3 ii TaxID=1339349 RepID=A0A078S2S4_BACUN|nr:hypothetical protein M094_1024 [Bacteroides uniformis str. 3978 T3 ii]KDS54424.1 hypothetical protein M094_4338 [Bacteroides uniformis str. 3978 T3 ii]KDS58315.1 hypothetical protein M093_3588 [Bacteroides uniformis str. 3978 T3 i]
MVGWSIIVSFLTCAKVHDISWIIKKYHIGKSRPELYIIIKFPWIV